MRCPSSRTSPPVMRPGGSSRPITAAPVSDLPAPELADHAQHLAGRDVEGDAIHRASVPRRVGNATLRSRTRDGAASPLRSLGLSASRSQSPSRFTDRHEHDQRRARERRHPPVAGEQEVVADADERAERRLRRRHADAEERERRLGDHGEPEPHACR